MGGIANLPEPTATEGDGHPLSVESERDGVVRLFVPCNLWTLNAERAKERWWHRKMTSAVLEAAGWAIRRSRTRLDPPVHVEARVYTQSGKGDVGGHFPAVKAAIDALVTMRVIPDDAPATVASLRMLPPRKVDERGPGVSLTFLPAR